MRKLIMIFIGLLLIQSATSYSEDTQLLNGEYYKTYQMSTNELPINISKGLHTLYFDKYNKTVQSFNNSDNSTHNKTVQINETAYSILYGDYIEGPSQLIINENELLNISIQLPELSVGTYESFIRVFNSTDLINETKFKFYVNYNSSLFTNDTPQEFNTDQNYLYFLWYDSELPKFRDRLHNIATEPNEKMTINCTGFLTCNKNYTTTGSNTEIIAHLEVPEGTALGVYKSYIFLNTSYGTSGNITYELDLRHTPIEIITKTVAADKPIENMSAEELIELFDSLQGVAERKVQELDAANRSVEVVKEVNISVPYMANKNEIINELAKYYNERQQEDISKLSKMNEELITETKSLLSQNTKLQSDFNNMTQNMTMLGIQHAVDLKFQNESIHNKNFVFNKDSVKKWGFITFLLLGMMIGTYRVYSNSWGGL